MPHRRTRIGSLAVILVALVATVLPQAPAAADPNPPVETYTYTPNMEPLGWEPRPNPASGVFNSDLAFWGNRAYQGTYDGFEIIDISNPEDPQQVLDYTACTGTSASNQGDLLVWGNLLMRSWNSNAGAGLTCDGQAVPSGFEGIHIFDISDEGNPELLTFIDLPCGSHTATGFPDLANDRFIIYNDPSSGTCPQLDIIQVPLSNPAGAAFIRSEPSGRACHDTAVVLGDAMLAACAGGNGFTVWSIGGSRGGTFEDPLQLHSQTVAGVTIGHSHTFSWEGDILIFGHEPGGGSAARCQSSSAQVDKTLFFYETETFTEVGQYILPRPQTSTENCTIHNFNVVPSAEGDILVHGSYQSGIGVVDFTDPTSPVEIAYADPAPLNAGTLVVGGDWSSYWYDGIIYESDITRGLLTWRLNDVPAVAAAQTLGHLNPQTQEFTIRSLICPPIGEYADDFEPQADTGWTVDTALDLNTPSDPWEVETDPAAHSASNSFATDATGLNEKDDRLIAPPQDISSSTHLIFWHRFATEAARDGGVLEVSTNGGSTWGDVGEASFVDGGYNGFIGPGTGSRIANRDAWTGNSPQPNVQTPVTVDLGAFAGEDVLLRWRYVGDPFRVGATPGAAWWVDDVSFSRLASNCRPIAIDDSATAINGIPVFVDVKANDLDPNNDTLTVTEITQPAHGTAVLQANQTVKYDPVCSFQGIDTFTYTISDGNGGTDIGLVSILVRKTSRRGSFPC